MNWKRESPLKVSGYPFLCLGLCGAHEWKGEPGRSGVADRLGVEQRRSVVMGAVEFQ